jgi:hypothetical protein
MMTRKQAGLYIKPIGGVPDIKETAGYAMRPKGANYTALIEMQSCAFPATSP